jgi:predicted ATPase
MEMTKDLRFCRLLLKNWKNFAYADVAIQNRIFLVGPNASGKSNLLDVFRFLRDLASSGGGFQESIGRRGGVTAIRCLAARRDPDVEIHVELKDSEGTSRWEYEIAFEQDNKHRPLLRKERVLHNDDEILARPNKQDRNDPDQLTQTYLEQGSVNQKFRDLATFFSSIRYLHIVPQLIREPDRSVGRSNDPFGGDFLEQIAKSPDRKRDARLRRIKEALRVAVPQLQEIELWRDARGTPHLRGKYQHWRPQGAWQTEEQFSDGTLRLMGLLWAALEGGGPLLLEEPELSLHPEIVRMLPLMFARVQRLTDRQIFISTHSPDLLRDEGIGLDEVLLFVPEVEGTSVTLAESHRDIRDLLQGGLSLADVVVPKTRPENVQQLTLFGDA